MASESGDSNMDREMILADFQVCLFCITQMFNTVDSNLFAIVEFPRTTANNSIHNLTGVVNSRPKLSFGFCG